MRASFKGGCCLALALLAAILPLAAPARAERVLLSAEAVKAKSTPGGAIADACGIALAGGQIYVSDYYHHAIEAFSASGEFKSQLPFATDSGPCQLAATEAGALYVNDWHEGVARLLPSGIDFDEANSTGIAVDQFTGNLYVDDRAYVAVYEPSGAPVLKEGLPLRIGQGTLADGYGLAVAGGRVYVPDASDRTVKVYEPAKDTVNPVLTISGAETAQHGFSSLVDASVAVDPESGHVLVVDNLQPGFEHPQAQIDEFQPNGAFLGAVSQRFTDAEPSGLAFGAGNFYASAGNAGEGAVLKFGPYSGGGAGPSEVRGPATSPASLLANASPPQGPKAPSGPSSLTQAVIIQRGGIKVSFEGELSPKKLPRHGVAPVRVAVAARIAGAEGREAPQLRELSIAINRYGRFDPTGLPICPERDIQPATTQNALRACRSSLVGVGSFEANVALSEQSPFPAAGKMYAFNGRVHGKPAILAHVYGTVPVPTSFTLPFVLVPSKGTYGTVLQAKLPRATGSSGYITGLSMNLGRSFAYGGQRHSYLVASCPAPAGFHKAVFPLAHATFSFRGGRRLGSTLVRSCGARG